MARLCANELSSHVRRCCPCEAIRRTAGPAASRRTENITQQSRSHGIRDHARRGAKKRKILRKIRWVLLKGTGMGLQEPSNDWLDLLDLRFWISPINSKSVSSESQSHLFVVVAAGKMISVQFGPAKIKSCLLCLNPSTLMCPTCVQSCCPPTPAVSKPASSCVPLGSLW